MGDRPQLFSGIRAATLGAIAATGLCAVWFVASAQSPAAAQDLFAVRVKVNDVIISGYDVDQRKRLVALGAPNASEEEIEAQALNVLISDELKLQEAERVGVTIPDDQIDDAVASVAQRNRQTVEELKAAIASAGVTEETFRGQLKAEIAWNELIRRRYGRRVSPSEAEIEAAMDSAAEEGPVRYDVRQIVVPLKPDAPQNFVRRAMEEAQRVKRELTSCDKIAELAPRYSKISGVVGRLTAERMPPPVRAAVTPLEVGQATDPLRSADGVHVIMLCGKETRQAANRRQVTDRLLQEKAGRFSESYLDDLRRTAMIESRQ